MLKIVQETAIAEVAGCSLLDEIARDGARQMLAAALHAEVAAYIDAHAELVDEDGRRLVVRNGHHEQRQVMTAAGAVEVRAPRVNDKRVDVTTGQRMRFSSAVTKGPAPRAHPAVVQRPNRAGLTPLVVAGGNLASLRSADHSGSLGYGRAR